MTHSRRAALGAAIALAALLAGCAASEPGAGSVHSRAEYEAFRLRAEGLLEPNYLPFMADRLVIESTPARIRRAIRAGLGLDTPPGEEWLVFCRWPEDRFPLAVFIEAPTLSDDLVQSQAPGATRDPEGYVAAVERALRRWEQGLEGLVAFDRVSRRSAADVVLRLRAGEPPGDDPYIQVLGTTPLGGACRYRGGDPRSGRVDADFRVPTLDIHVADQYGLLLADQVERIALHELGHALGMRTHSPIPADLMYRVVRDRLPRGELGTEDVNSFLSLYRLPPGTVYGRIDGEEPAPAPDRGPPPGVPRLETTYGVVAVDGVTWDYEASFQLNVRAYASVREYLERYGAWHLASGRVLESGPVEDGPYPGVHLVLGIAGERIEEITLLEPGDGRIVVVIWDCPASDHPAWQPWFRAALASLELRSPRSPAADRDYEADVDAP